jgi:UDP-3-O-[3-hydroxymyristoyl] glucosamine N-acyltransferase
MEFTAKMIAEFLHGEIEGNPDAKINNVSKIEEGKEGTLAFLANPKYTKYIYSTQASIVLVNKSLELEEKVSATLIRVDDAYQAFAALLQLYEQYKPKKTGINDKASIAGSAILGKDPYVGDFAYIGDNVKVGDNVKIYPQAYIGDNVKIGNNTIIYAGAKIYTDCVIGQNCIIHAGAVIGSDGFGFAPQEGNNYNKIPQIGNVVLEDDVEIGSNTTIDRATMGSTILRKGVKIDNLVQIAHNVEVGENTVIVSQVGIAGSTKIGKNCMIAGQVGIVGHITIADGVKIAAQSGISNSVTKPGEIMLGSPPAPISEMRKIMVIYRRLPELKDKVDRLENEMKLLKK